MKKLSLVMIMLGLLGLTALPAQAADFEVQNTMEDALYGGAIGALVGAGAMLVSSTPSKNVSYIATGAGFGIIIGAIYGVTTGTRALAKVEDGQLQIAIPIPELALTSNSQALALNVPLWESRF
ncbi:MAG: hypothetical protein CO186_06060 [Zetaproteobacteria bacterium CG_4_9_14_3_um_filter_49_83]|nr:MAG: hypothetical protein AUJ56_13145 [Zetaproteobacteria bacterium CG1_02_49_23]PIQ34732.1 MAG: hypothetical protein COW62_00755 [Zetaproteobacteria bacterium CG17_big_fil_post_rev_8_21_14_2_50_50_13]PIY56823.1 MAG: hypothetical protein COZ00_02215 [Zetaproteobacteria bacterium CG_4_10_14_0_8_um_filter_49_80]PJA35407.1 MAG: hypothetical protein CO186_06060 [Zetaproteobacteria bacterium CG_4_9_14_3_um_filter_49_83]